MGKIKDKKIKQDEIIDAEFTMVDDTPTTIDLDSQQEFKNRHILGTLDYSVKRLVKSVEILEKRTEFLSLVYDDDTFKTERFGKLTDEEVTSLKESIEVFPQEHLSEFADTLGEVNKLITKLHTILNKR